MEHIEQIVSQYGYGGIFSLLMLGIVGLPVPDETLLTVAGYLVYRGDLRLGPVCVVAYLGTVCGITVSYLMGRLGAMYVVTKFGPYMGVTREKLDRAHQWFARVGKWGLTIGYFLPGIRHFVALVAGASKLELPTFALFAYSGGLAWSISFILAGYYLGKDWHVFSGPTHHLLGALVPIAIVVVMVYVMVRKKKARTEKEPPATHLME